MTTTRAPIRLIIGLGNPEPKYANTYHSVGLLAIDMFTNLVSPLTAHLMRSTTSMNLSGQFVSRALREMRVSPAELLIIHDDSDLAVGTYQLSFGRGAAGHHGIESTVAALGTNDFWRLRIGIRPSVPEHVPRQKAGSFVLKPMPREQQVQITEAIERACEDVRAQCAKNEL